MHDLGKDLRFGFRMLLKRPGTSALAITALALGIGLTTTMFSIVDAAFLRGLPFAQADRIQALTRQRLSGGGGGAVPPHDFADWRAAQHSFEDLAADWTFPANVSSSGDVPERYRGASITPNTLHLLRVAPLIGRDFSEADGRPGAPPVTLISYNIWVGRFQRSDTVVGRMIRINGEMTTVIGVMPPKFGFPQTQDLWVPLQLTLPSGRGDGRSLDVIGRLRPGVGVASAQADMTVVAGQLARQYPENKDVGVLVQPYVRRFIGIQIIATLSTMLGAVFGVLLIACVNVTNLQLARAAERTKEMAVRLALGASRGRIVRQLLVEGFLMSLAGAALGLGIAHAGTVWFMGSIADTNPPFWIDVHIDSRVLLFVTALSVVAAVASSLVPALRVAQQNVNDALKDEGRSSTGLRVGAFSRVLVVVEMTLSFVLLVVSGLMIKSVIATTTVSYPFATDLLVARTMLNDADYQGDARVRQMTEQLRTRLAGAPGVRAIALGTSAPGNGGTYNLFVEGQASPPTDARRPQARRIDVSPGFFDVLKIHLRMGRLINETDMEGTLPVAVVSEDLVQRFFPDGEVIGRRIAAGANPNAGSNGRWLTIVGVVPAVSVAAQANDTTETVFTPLTQTPSRDLMFFAAAGPDPAAAGPTLRRAVMTVDPNLPLFDVNSLQGQFDQSSWPFRVFGGLFMTFGLAALLMAAAGLYGVMSFAVRRRTQEIGVRMALGADRARIVRMVVRQGAWQVGVGVVLGFGLGGFLGSSLKLLLFHVDPWDPAVFGVTIGVLGAAGVLASLVPALRAASVDPLKALRHD